MLTPPPSVLSDLGSVDVTDYPVQQLSDEAGAFSICHIFLLFSTIRSLVPEKLLCTHVERPARSIKLLLVVRLGELSLDTSQAVKRDGLPIQFLFEKTRLLFRGSFANNPFHHLRRQPIGKTVLTVLNTLPDHFLRDCPELR